MFLQSKVLTERQINSNNVISEFSYRPDRNIEVGFRIKAGRSEDGYPATPTIIDLNSQLIRFNLSFLGTGRLRVEIERNELIANTTQNLIPYELTAGNQIGKNYFWRLNFDYKLSSFCKQQSVMMEECRNKQSYSYSKSRSKSIF